MKTHHFFLGAILSLVLLGFSPCRAQSNYPITFNTVWNWNGAPTFTQVKASNAMNAVMGYYEGILSGSYAGETVTIDATWNNIGMGDTTASARPAGWISGASLVGMSVTTNGIITNANAVYANAAANQVAGKAVTNGISIIMRAYAPINWDWSTTTTAYGASEFRVVNFYTTLIHEIGHGLGFDPRINQDGTGAYISNEPSGFGTFQTLGVGTNSTNYLVNMTEDERSNSIKSDNIYFNGPNATNLYGGPGKIFSPTNYLPGSSMSHLDYSVDTNRRLLMYPSSGPYKLENIMYSPLELGIFEDMGYSLNVLSIDGTNSTTILSGTNSYALVYIGSSSASSNNTIVVGDPTSVTTNTSGLYIGYGGNGNALIISNRGSVFDYDAYIGFSNRASNNSVLVTGSNSLWTNANQLTIGNQGSGSSLTISNGGHVASYLGYIGLTGSSSNNTVLVAGNGSLWSNNLTLVVGYQGAGKMDLVDGGSVAASSIVIADSNSSVGTINIGSYGGSSAAGYLITPTILFGSGSGTMNFNQNNTVIIASAISSSITGQGAVNQIGIGTTILTGNNSQFSGITKVTNGTLQIGDGSSRLAAVGTGSFFLTNSSSLIFKPASNAVISIQGTISGAGSLEQDGSGKTIISGSNSYSGNTVISAGTLQADNGHALGASAVSLGGRATSATLVYTTNVTISSLLWGSNSMIAPGPNQTTLTITGQLNGSVPGTIDLSNYYAVGTNSILTFGSSSFFTNASDFSVVGSDTNWSILLTGGTNLETVFTQSTYAGPNLFVGSNSSFQTVNLFTNSSPTSFSYSNTYVGYVSNAIGNVLTVANSGTLLSNSVDLYVGYSGGSNELKIANGAMVAHSNGWIGFESQSTGNMMTVTDRGSLLSNRGNLTIGYTGSSNTLDISNGAQVISGIGYIGWGSNSSKNSTLVSGVDANGNSSQWSNSDALIVGYSGSANNLMISDGGQVMSSNGFIGNGVYASNNTVLVSGVNAQGNPSQWSNSALLMVGNNGSANKLMISNGGQVMSSSGYLGYSEQSVKNTVLVGGAETALFSANLYVGYNGSSNGIIASNGGLISGQNQYLGTGANSSNNTVLVTGVDTLGVSSEFLGVNLFVGYNGSGNSLTVSNGGLVGEESCYLGAGSNSSNNSVLVTGVNANGTPSQLNSRSLAVGYLGGGNNLMISSGGRVVSEIGHIGYDAGSSFNSVVISGGGPSVIASCWYSSGDITAGYSGSGNSITISNGGRVEDFNGAIGWDTNSSNNMVVVTGFDLHNTASLWNNRGNLLIGNAGSYNTLMVSDAGQVANNQCAIGSNANSSNNMVVVTGENSLLSSYENLIIGVNGKRNILNISNGGLVSAGGIVIGFGASSISNMVVVTGPNAKLLGNLDLYVGNEGTGNSLLVSNGGIVSANILGSNRGVVLGGAANSSNNTVVVTGNGSSLSNNFDLYVGLSGSGNSLFISNGGVVSANITGSAQGIVLGGAASSSNNMVVVTGSNSHLTTPHTLAVGGYGSGNTLVISNAAQVMDSIGFIGYGVGSLENTTLVTGANSLWSNSFGLFIGNEGGGTLTLVNGGVVISSGGVSLASSNGATGTLNIGSLGGNDSAGTIYASTISFGSGSGTINFNQSNTATLTSSISGLGKVQQLGLGATIISGNNNFTGTTLIRAGTLLAASTNALGGSTVSMGGTASLATLALATNLNVSSLTWATNGVIALAQGTHTLTLSGMTNSAGTNNGANVFRLLNTDLSNATNMLINYTSLTGFTTNSFSVSGISGYSFSTNGNKVSAYLSTTANVVVSNNTTISDTLTVGSFTASGGSTMVVSSGGVLNSTKDVMVTSSSTLDNNGLIVTPTLMVDQGSTLMGSGTLSLTGGNLTVNGTVAPGNSPGTFFVTGGNLVMGSTAVWDEEIYSTSVYDRVVVTGSAFLNGTMNITNYGSGGLQYGQQYNFLTASEGISGAFTSIIAPEGFRGRLLLSGNNTEANILIAPSSYTLLAQGNNQIQVATALDSFIPTTSGDQLVVSTSLDSLSASQYNQAFNAIMPTMYQSMATIAFNQANALNMQLNQRLWGVRLAEGGGFSMSGLADNYAMLEGQGDGAGSGKGVLDSKKDILRPGLDNHWGMFVDANGIFAKANSGNMLPGYNAQSGGITAGLTYKWNDSFASGLYCGYQGTYSKMGANGSGLGTGSSLIDNAVRFGVFGTYGHKDGKGLYANALAGGAYHNYQATRVIQYTGVNRTANSAPGAGELDTMLATGYDIQKGKFTFGPTASLQYTYLGVNKVNETGAQSLNFNSGGWNSSSMLSSVGAHAAYNWQAGKNVVVVPQISLNWQHEFLQNPYNITGNLGGTSPTFSNTSATGIRDYLYTGVGFTVELNKKWNTSFFYNAAAGNNDLVSQNIFWSAGVKF